MPAQLSSDLTRRYRLDLLFHCPFQTFQRAAAPAAALHFRLDQFLKTSKFDEGVSTEFLHIRGEGRTAAAEENPVNTCCSNIRRFVAAGGILALSAAALVGGCPPPEVAGLAARETDCGSNGQP